MTAPISLEAYIAQIAPTLQPDLVKDAIKAGWPRNLASALTLVGTPGGLEVEYPRSLAKDIEDLEYGDKGSPKPVFRNFIAKHDIELYNQFSELLADDLAEVIAN